MVRSPVQAIAWNLQPQNNPNRETGGCQELAWLLEVAYAPGQERQGPSDPVFSLLPVAE